MIRRIDRTLLLVCAVILGARLIGAVPALRLTEARSGVSAGIVAPLQVPVAVPPAVATAVSAQLSSDSSAPPSAGDTASVQQLAAPSPAAPQSPADAPSDATAPAAPASSPTTEPPPAASSPTAAAPAPATPTVTPAPESSSVFDNSQVVALYGSPLSPDLGVLGLFPPDEAAHRLIEEAGIYDNLNGDRHVTPAIDLIYGQAQSDPTPNGLYIRYLDDSQVQAYLDVAERYDLQLILDLHIGRSNAPDEVRKIERFLVNPRVHVAIDPEYAVGPSGVPLWTPGRISGNDINDVQDYLASLVAQYHLPPKMLVMHQYLDATVVDGGVIRQVPNVDLVLNMDGIGAPSEKIDKYQMFASRPYAVRRSYNVFILQDHPVLSEDEIMHLSPQPDMVMYQ